MSTTKRLSSNLRGNKKRRFSVNKTNLRKSVLKKSTKNKKKNSLRRGYSNSNVPKFPKLQQIYASHVTNLENYKRSEIERKKKERNEALKEAKEAPAYLSILGENFEVEPSERMMEQRMKYVNTYYPGPQPTTYEQSKKFGPKGTKKAIQRIRKGKTKTRCLQDGTCPEQRTYNIVGLPYNIDNTYIRGPVPELIKQSHLDYNTSKYASQPYMRFKQETTLPRQYGRFSVTPSSLEPVPEPSQRPKKLGRFTVTSAK